ncbi:MAG TPA: hypothetical protein VFN77_04535 [Acetobacteraceae bacterium]|nr:hypothetical protein [Acetobacteraceae bacterium]
MAFDSQLNLDQRIKALSEALASVAAIVDPETAVSAACALLARQLNGASVAILRGDAQETVAMAQFPATDQAAGLYPLFPGTQDAHANPDVLTADLVCAGGIPAKLVARRGRREQPFDSGERRVFLMMSGQIAPLLQRMGDVPSRQYSGPVDAETGIWGSARFLEEAARRFDRLDIEERAGTMLVFGWVRSDGSSAPEASGVIVRASVEVLQDMLRPTDLLGRIGPFRLAAWCDGVDHLIAAERAERIGSRLDALLAPSARHVAIGIATRWPHRRDDTTTLLEQAGAALLKARAAAALKKHHMTYVWQQSDGVM